MANTQTFRVNINITIREDEVRKSYDFSKEYNGDPKKLDVSVLIDGWFIENNIDKSKLDSLNVSVWNKNDSELLNY